MTDYAGIFESTILLSFAIVILLSGLFTAYFGAGRSRKIGLGLTLVGLLGILVFISFTWDYPAGAQHWLPGAVAAGVTGVVGAGIGGIVAIVIFLVAIMRA
ncbi:MAG: hypothetical protein ACYDDF_14245 [Thermoplasmatota archaeon]